MPAKPADAPTVALASLALAAGLAAAWPPLHLVLVNADLATFYHENIGYRFFWVLRLIDGAPGEYVDTGQGVLQSLIQAVYYLAGKRAGLDLWGQINLFGQLTLGVPAIAMLVLAFLIALDRSIDPGLRAALVAAPLVMGLGHAHIFAYDLYPDYLAYTKVFFLLFSWRWLHHRGWQGIVSPRAASELGVLGGLLAALKINYGAFPAGLLLASVVLTAVSRPRAALALGAVAVLGGSLTLCGLFLLYYGGDIPSLIRFFASFLAFAHSLAAVPRMPLEPFASWSTNSNSNLAWLIVLLAGLCLLGLRGGGARPILLSLALALLGAMALAMAYWRGGGTSYFDAVVVVSLLCALAPATFDDRRLTRTASLGLAAVFVLWPAAWVLTHWGDYVTDNGLVPRLESARGWQRGLYDWNRTRGLPVYVVTSTNSLLQGTIEDMMMRGLTNFTDSWYVSNDNPTRKALFPQFHFVSYNMFDIFTPPPRFVLMWVDAHAPIAYASAEELDRHRRKMTLLLRGLRREDCYHVRQPDTGAEILSCIMSRDDHPS